MKRFWGYLWAAGLVAGIGGVVLPACAHNDSTLFIRQVQFPPTASPGQGCLYSAAAEASPALFSGHFDVGLSSSYSPVVLVANQLTARGDPLNVRTETARVQLRGAIVRVTDSVGNELSSFTSLTDGFIDPSQGATPSYGQAAVTIIDPETSKLFRDPKRPDGSPSPYFLGNRGATRTVLTYFKVFGQTIGGTYVESGETQFVITVCNGCLVSFPADASTSVTKYNCDAPVPVQLTGGTVLVPCAQGQESAVDCRLCKGLPACNPDTP